MANEVVIHVRMDNAQAIKSQSEFEKVSKSSGERAGKNLSDGVGEGFKKNNKGNDDIVKRLAQGFRDAKELAIPVLASAGVAAAPLLAGALAAGVIGGVGIGGIVGGVALVADDPAIKNAGSRLGKNFMADLKIRAEPFKQPVMDALGIIERASLQTGVKIGQVFKNTAASVVPLTRSIVQGADNILDGVVKMSRQSTVVLGGFGDAFVSISEGVENFLGSLAEAGPEAANAIRDVGENIKVLVTGIGDVIEFAAKLRESGLGGFLADLVDKLNPLGNGLEALKGLYKEVGGGSKELAGEQKNLADAARNTGKAAKTEEEAFASLAAELKAQTDPVFGLMRAQDKLRTAHDRVAEATKKHGRNSREARQAIRDLGAAAIDMQGKASQLSGSFDGKLSPALRNTFRAAGLTKGEINRLEREFRDAHNAGMSFARTYKAKMILEKVTKETFIGPVAPGSPFSKAHGGIAGAAGGGVRSNMTLVGEHGPELAELPPGTHVRSNPDSMRMMGNGGATYVFNVNAYAPIGNYQQLQNWLAESIDTLRRQGRLA